jgi:hypothetical protein
MESREHKQETPHKKDKEKEGGGERALETQPSPSGEILLKKNIKETT